MQSTPINVVLIRPQYALNIGATARAMSNMGVSQLILIDKQCSLDKQAQRGAAHAQDELKNRKEYRSLKEFYSSEPEGIRVAFSARQGHDRPSCEYARYLKKVFSPSQKKLIKPSRLYLFFGPEDDGLTNEDIEYSHQTCWLPTFGSNTSLNLSQSVLLALYITQNFFHSQNQKFSNSSQLEKPTHLPQLDLTIKKWVEELGFRLNARSTNAHTVLRRLLLQNIPTPKEIKVLESIFYQALRKSKSQKKS